MALQYSFLFSFFFTQTDIFQTISKKSQCQLQITVKHEVTSSKYGQYSFTLKQNTVLNYLIDCSALQLSNHLEPKISVSMSLTLTSLEKQKTSGKMDHLNSLQTGETSPR